jgi:uncharacterized protein
MSSKLLDDLITYIDGAVDQAPIRRVVFGFHGGEPTLAKAAKVRTFCKEARRRLEQKVEVGFVLQTNGVHVSDDWLRLIEEEHIGIGISVDGEKHVHDRYRVDHSGRGSYDRVRNTLKRLLLLEAAGATRLTTLAVMGPDFSGIPFYRHLVEDLGLRCIKLLFEDRTNDMPLTSERKQHLAQMLCDIFDYWLIHHSGQVEVVLFNTVVRGILASHYNIRGARDRITIGFALLSDGRIRIQDDFMIASEWFWAQCELHVFDSEFVQYLKQPHLQTLIRQTIEPPTPCRQCRYVDSCGGGEIAHRYRRASGFDNKSVYCDVLTTFYRHVEMRLTKGKERLESREKTPEALAGTA